MDAKFTTLLQNPKFVEAVMIYDSNYSTALGPQKDEANAKIMARALTILHLKKKGADETLANDGVDLIEEYRKDRTNGHSTPTEISVGASAAAAPVATDAKPHAESRFKRIALAAIARGEKRILPIVVGAKNPAIKWAHEPIHNASTQDWETQYASWIDQLDAQFSDLNACVVANGNEFLFIDEDDSAAFRKGYEAFVGEPFPVTYTTSARENRCQSHWRQTDATRKLGNVPQDSTKDGMISVRQHQLYVLAEGSLHPSGSAYKAVVAAPIIPMPDKLVAYLQSLLVTTKNEKTGLSDSPRNERGLVPHGFIHPYLVREAGRLRNMGMTIETLEDALLDLAHQNCEPPLDDNKIRQVARSAEGWEEGGNTELFLNQTPDAPGGPAPISTTPALLIPDEDPMWEYAITREEFEQQMENEFPVLRLKLKVGPTWDDDIMYGVAGDIVRKAAEYCEAHPAGMYLDILVSFGNIVGRSPYFNVSSTSHYANEFMVRVGDSSKSRKGTGRDAINEVLKMVDANWYRDRVMSGFGSAEAIINEIRDDSVQSVRKRKNNTFENVVVPGVADKRLMIREGELASIFQLAGKPESRADVVLRDGWDGHALRNLVKGKSDGLSNSNMCQFPHISISADTTQKELLAKMPKGAESNGFGNRFLYCYVQRVKLCPNGGPAINWAPELQKLHEALTFARDLQYVGMQNSARKVWNRMYSEIEKETTSMSGLSASMAARAAAHVRRLALILCLLDNKDCIETVHLRAAKKIWDYCQDSARFIFGGLTRDQEMILGWLRKIGPATVTQVTQQLFQKHRKAAWVRLQVNGLIGAGKVELKGDQILAKP